MENLKFNVGDRKIVSNDLQPAMVAVKLVE